jgi:3-oxoacyl-[acyl-carrier protein] reductase
MSKITLITGASGEIGGEIARTLAARGFSIAAAYSSNKLSAENLCANLTAEFPVSACPIKIDLSDLGGISTAVENLKKNFGTPSVLVNNGGCESIGLFQDLSDAQLIEVMHTDLVGTMLLTKTLLPDFLRTHSGYIVNISSVWGEVGASCEVAYSAAKAGIIGFTKALAKECAPSGISVNCISPGFIDTKMNAQLSETEKNSLIEDIPCSRAGTPHDIANTAAFLVSGKADYLCGQVIRIDGGWL